MLRGRDFGDPLWSYLDVRIVRCTNMSPIPVATDPFTNTSVPFPEAWSGTCAPYDDIDALVDAGTRPARQPVLQVPPRSLTGQIALGPLHAGPPEDNSMENGLDHARVPQMSSSSHVECRLYLKHTEAYVNRPRSFGSLFGEEFSLGLTSHMV